MPTLWDKKLNTIVNNESSEVCSARHIAILQVGGSQEGSRGGQILRMLNSEFNEFVSEEGKAVDLYPVDLRSAIDAVNDWVYPNINNGVYRCGFARTQEAYVVCGAAAAPSDGNMRCLTRYDEAFDQLFEALDRVEGMLEHSRFLTGNRLTEADIRLFVTLLRFGTRRRAVFHTPLLLLLLSSRG